MPTKHALTLIVKTLNIREHQPSVCQSSTEDQRPK
jgi:hypothetical protein